MKNLVIVESPAKAKTIEKYLGKDFHVLSSVGHIRSIAKKTKDGTPPIDVKNGFATTYEIDPEKKKVISELKKQVKAVGPANVWLATDEDREGEAIAWHLCEVLKLDPTTTKRIVFHEITKPAIEEAIKHPRTVDMKLVEAQQARQILDRVVGFELSPVVWRKVPGGKSAGRVQSPAVRLLVEREREIEAFNTSAQFKVTAIFIHDGQEFNAELKQRFDTEKEATEFLGGLVGATYTVSDIAKSPSTRNPSAPFTTSTLQQEANSKLGMSSKATMASAQKLYQEGRITYMRTDSVTLSQDAITEIRHYIDNKIGADFLPKSPRMYRTKSKNAQEAHEAIRPTSVYRTPESVKPFLSADQFKLYQMIWQRTMACQMVEAKFDATTVDIGVGEGVFRATGQVLVFAGFLSVYQEGHDEDDEDEDNKKLPELAVGDALPVDKLYGEQHFTQPPPRFNEATLVKALEEFGIGRPSTYASIIKTLKDREYVTIDQRRFLPTDTGEIVNKFLTEHFTQYVDYDFTAKLEDQLDDIASGKRQWIPVMDKFWKGFHKQIEEKAGIERAKITTEELDETCPKCGQHKLQIKFGKRGRFIACSGYPDCDYTRNLNETAEEAAKAAEEPTVVEGRECPKCGGQLVYKKGRFGKFIGCANYPKCKHIEPLEKPKDTGVACPKCGKGSLIERKSRYGKLFYSCNTYPDCDYATWNPPVAEECPKCHWPVLTIKTTKRWGVEKVCPQKECGWKEQIEPPAPKG